MSAHIETIHHVLCFDCGLDETYRWSDEARDARDEHNATHHSGEPVASGLACGCSCHTMPGVMHIAACCSTGLTDHNEQEQ